MQKVFFSLGLSIIALTGVGQDAKRLERAMLRELKRIYYWNEYRDTTEGLDKFDSLQQTNVRFRNLLLRYTTDYPASFSARLSELRKEGLGVVTSPDGRLRVYSWDTCMGGSAHQIDNLIQYKTDEGKIRVHRAEDSLAEDSFGSWYLEIIPIRVKERTYYLAIREQTWAHLHYYSDVKAFRIDGPFLNTSAKLIRTGSGLQNTLGYDFTASPNADEGFHYDASTRTLSFPLVLEDGTVTKRRIRYRFTGRYFEKQPLTLSPVGRGR